jgi:FKBP-type peptidyl-prolyl cis-trans isomerase
MKREHVIALCFVIVAIFLCAEKGMTDFWKSPAETRGDQRLPDGSWSALPAPENAEQKRRQTSSNQRKARQKTVTESGLVYMVLEQGEGEHPGPSSSVKVHYTGTFKDGTVFDSSRDSGTPAVFPLNAVIKGLSEGLQLMKPGSRYQFEIPPHLAYGDSGAGVTIPPGSTLTFEVELISIEAP